MKIGFFKQTVLPTSFIGDFWRMGTTIIPYLGTLPTNFERELNIEVQFHLYKDFDCYLNDGMYAESIWIKTTLPYSKLENNSFNNIIDKISTIEDCIFFECESFDLSNPL